MAVENDRHSSRDVDGVSTGGNDSRGMRGIEGAMVDCARSFKLAAEPVSARALADEAEHGRPRPSSGR